jgi:serine/threonine protein kinase
MATLTGQTLGGFLIEEELGRGAMGVVFKARQLSMDRPVALKFLPKRMAQNEKVVARFQREARAAGQLSHPNIVAVFDVGIVDGLHYIAMELVDGSSVHKRLKENGPYSEKDTLEIAAQIAEALKMAHGRKILHRDIKPDNFLIDSERVRLADLGLARFMKEGESSKDAELTQDGTTMGTPHYMSPEQCKGVAVDHRSDLYSLGASMYVMATNQTPFDAASAAGIMVKVITETPRSLKEAGPHLTAGFVALVEKLMAKDPEKRFQSAQELLDAIGLCKTGEYKATTAKQARVTGNRRAASASGEKTSASRLRPMLLGAAAAVVSLVVLGVMLSKKGGEPKTPLSETPVSSDGKTSNVAPANPAKTNPNAVPVQPSSNAAGAEDDDEKKHGAHKEFRALREELPNLVRRNPSLAVDRIDELLKQFPRAKFANALMDDLKEARAAREALIREWAEAQAIAKRDAADGQYQKAMQGLIKFRENHEGTAEADEAAKLLAGVIADVQNKAKLAAGKGDLAESRKLLNEAIEMLPSDLEAPLVLDLRVIDERQRANAVAAESDSKVVAEITEKAQQAAREPDTLGDRYRFSEAAAICDHGVSRLKSDQAKVEVGALQQVYARAAGGLDKVKKHIGDSKVKLSALGKFSEPTLTAWKDNAIEFLPKGMPAQTLRVKALSPDQLMQIVDAVKALNGIDAYDHGAIAFAAGVEHAARLSLTEASALEPAIKATVDAALKSFKVDPNDRNAAARQLFAEAQEAKARKDFEMTRELTRQLITEYAQTDFVQHNLDTINALQSGEDVKKAALQKDEKKELTKEESIAELKKLGWTVKGEDWQQDPKKKTAYNVKDGVLSADANEIKASFQAANEKTSIGIFLRYEDEGTKERRRGGDQFLRRNKVESGPGYGVLIENGELSVYGAKTFRLFKDEYPVPGRTEKFPLPQASLTITVAVVDKALEITINQKKYRYTEKLRNEGGAVITIDGSAKVDSPSFKK